MEIEVKLFNTNTGTEVKGVLIAVTEEFYVVIVKSAVLHYHKHTFRCSVINKRKVKEVK